MDEISSKIEELSTFTYRISMDVETGSADILKYFMYDEMYDVFELELKWNNRRNGYDGKGVLTLLVPAKSSDEAMCLAEEYASQYFKVSDVRIWDEKDTGKISDGYHTFDELYYHRMILFSIICNTYPSKAWKSKMHADGTMYPGYFIAGIDTPSGTYSYHCELKYWDKFNVKHLLIAQEWDGHQPGDIERLESLLIK